MDEVKRTAESNDVRNLTCDGRNRIALATVSMGVLLVSLDSTSVITALPNMEADLGLSKTDLGWVLSAFLLTYSSFRLLSGYLSDLYGNRAVFLNGLIIFAAACLAGGLSTSRELLFGSRAIQGAAGAIIATSAMSLLADIFTNATEQLEQWRPMALLPQEVVPVACYWVDLLLAYVVGAGFSSLTFLSVSGPI